MSKLTIKLKNHGGTDDRSRFDNCARLAVEWSQANSAHDIVKFFKELQASGYNDEL